MSMDRIAIIGAGQAAAVAARTLRRRGYDGSVVLLGDEVDRPYQRPPLSKDYLTDGDDSSLWLLPQDWTDAQQVEVRTGTRVERLDAGAGAVHLESGASLACDQVLIATGGRPRQIPGASGERVHVLRTRSDADRLRGSLKAGARLIIVGAGFIGAEVASSARSLGAEVTVLEAGPAPMQRVLGERLGNVCGRIQRDAGVDLRLGVAVDGISDSGSDVIVHTSAGPVVADVVVVAIGILPNDEVGVASGLRVDNGIHVDEWCRTSNPHVYAAGDVANHFHPLFGTRMRVEHFDNASKQAAAAANNMLGRATQFRDPHWFWSDQFGRNIQAVGHPEAQHDLVIRGDLEGLSFTAFFLAEGVMRAAFAVDRGEDITMARELVSAGARVSQDFLADEDADLFEALTELEDA